MKPVSLSEYCIIEYNNVHNIVEADCVTAHAQIVVVNFHLAMKTLGLGVQARPSPHACFSFSLILLLVNHFAMYIKCKL